MCSSILTLSLNANQINTPVVDSPPRIGGAPTTAYGRPVGALLGVPPYLSKVLRRLKRIPVSAKDPHFVQKPKPKGWSMLYAVPIYVDADVASCDTKSSLSQPLTMVYTINLH